MKYVKHCMCLLFVFVFVLGAAMSVSAAGSVSLNKTKDTLYLGESETLKVSGAKGKVSWSTSDKNVVAVSSKGKITAKKEGKATIKAKVSGKTLSCKVTVKKEGLSSKKLTLGEGQSETLKLRGKGKIQAVKSSKTSVATVIKSGKVTAKKTGKAKITITSNSGKNYSCKVTVKKASLSSSNIAVVKSDYADVSLDYATLKSVKSSNKKIVKAVKKSGKIRITAVEKGSAEITVKDTRGKKYTCNVSVEEPSISAAALTLALGETSRLRLNGNSQKITWISGNSSVASVDGSGNVTGLASGSTVITAKVGHKSFKCSVTVVQQYTVTFNTNGGSNVASQTVKEGGLAKKPVNPTKARSVFVGWYIDSSLTKAYNFNTPVNSNITLYAKWNLVRYTVTFNTNGGSEIIPQQVYKGERAYKPMDPVKQGYVFAGWYINSGLTSAYHFTTLMSDNITLYAKWTPIEVHINLTPDTEETYIVNRTVNGDIAANIAISSISYKLKGDNNEVTGEISLQNAADFSLPVLLEDGNNILEVTVTTIEGTNTSDSITMEYDSGYVYELANDDIIIPLVEEGDSGEITVDEIVTDSDLDGTDNGNTALETSISCMGNVFDLYFDSDISFLEREDFVENTLHGEMVGYLNAVDMMQVRFEGKLPALGNTDEISLENITLEEVKEYADNLVEQYSDYLESADLEFEYDKPTEEAVITDDPWNGEISKYWITMVGAEEAWNYDNYNNLDFLTNINLGIVDAGFDTNHEDLKERIHLIGGYHSPHDHGTHVAGIIAAEADNGKGIAGIMHNNGFIQAYDAQGEREGMSTSAIMEGLTKTVETGAKVVNFSLGSSSNVSGREQGWLKAWLASMESKKYSKTMCKLLERGFDFIVVQSAGNGNKEQKGIDYWNNGVFCSIDYSNCYSHGDVTKSDIINRILVVSAVDGSGSLTSFSNGNPDGDLNVIAAPGASIYSCVTSENGKYGSMSGTSMAAPVVTAACGLTWSMNPALAGDEVVNLIMENTSGVAASNESAYTIGGMGIVNVNAAVCAAYETRTCYYGSVVDAVDGDDGVDAVITIYKADGTAVSQAVSTESYSGYFELPKLPAGYYKLGISAEEYATKTINLRVAETGQERYNLGKIAMSTGLEENQYRIILRWGEYPEDLDSHLVANLESGSSYHVYYSDKNPLPAYANLDWDDTDSYGPETITITNIEALYEIKYAVHDYTNKYSSYSTELSNSGANVEVWKGSTLMYTFYVPANMGGTEWDVFAFDAGGNIIPINTMTYCSEPENVLNAYEPDTYGMQLYGAKKTGSLKDLLKRDEAVKETNGR